jgi:hypothetical protein
MSTDITPSPLDIDPSSFPDAAQREYTTINGRPTLTGIDLSEVETDLPPHFVPFFKRAIFFITWFGFGSKDCVWT